MQRTTVLLLFGGESSEHGVSISSAQNVFSAIDSNKYEVVLAYIDKAGKWWLVDKISDPVDIDESRQLLPILGYKSFLVTSSNEVIKPGVILPILHGVNGEDGSVQGLAQLLHIPIVGCDIEASAICMDKVTTKQLLEFIGIKTVPFVVHLKDDLQPDFDELSNKLGNELFIKPANGGSSIGISKAMDGDGLLSALAVAHQYDRKVLIEKSIVARELEVGVLGSKNVRVTGVGEIKPDREFYDFESKYDQSSQTEVIIPADIPDELAQEIRSIAQRAYIALGCNGLSRIDFFLSSDNQLYINEINTLPGFTNISMYPKLWDREGLRYADLIDALITDALEK